MGQRLNNKKIRLYNTNVSGFELQLSWEGGWVLQGHVTSDSHVINARMKNQFCRAKSNWLLPLLQHANSFGPCVHAKDNPSSSFQYYDEDYQVTVTELNPKTFFV